MGKRLLERKEPLDNHNGIMKATESPWFLVRASNLMVREVSIRLLLLALLSGPRTDQQGAKGSFPV